MIIIIITIIIIIIVIIIIITIINLHSCNGIREAEGTLKKL